MELQDRLAEKPDSDVLVVEFNVLTKASRWWQAMTCGLLGVLVIASLLQPALLALKYGVLEFAGAGCLAVLAASPFLVGAVWILRFKSHEIRCDAKGISFRTPFDMYLLGQTERTWGDVHSVEMAFDLHNPIFLDSPWLASCANYAQIQNSVVIEFKSGGKAFIPIRMLKKAQLGEWLNFVRRRLHSGCFSEDALKLHKLCSDGCGGTAAFPWQDDLSSRHVGTNYGPLSRDYQLQSGRYRVVSHLQSGGMSSVYLVLKTDDGTRAVLKEAVLPLLTADDHKVKARELFQREALLLSSIKHDQIVVVIDAFSENDRDYMVLQYVPGPTLRDVVLKTGKLPASRVIKLTQQLLDVLSYLHELDPPVIHRDVTPENLILREDGKVVLVDFGAANQFIGTATGTFIGKQCYMAPEQLRGKASPASDLYALGATLYYLLTGRDPVPLSQSSLTMEETSNELRLLNEVISQCTNLEEHARPSLAEVKRKIELSAKAGVAV